MNEIQRYLLNSIIALFVISSALFLFGFGFAAAVPDGWAAWRVGVCFGLVGVVGVVIVATIIVLNNL